MFIFVIFTSIHTVGSVLNIGDYRRNKHYGEERDKNKIEDFDENIINSDNA